MYNYDDDDDDDSHSDEDQDDDTTDEVDSDGPVQVISLFVYDNWSLISKLLSYP